MMRNHKHLAAAALFCGLAIVAVACVLAFDGGAFASALAEAPRGLVEFMVANPTLLALQTRHAELTRQAEARRAELRDGMTAEQTQPIEAAHAELVRQAADVQRQIDELQRAAPPAPGPAPAPTDAAVQAAITAERTRVAEINAIGARAGLAADVTALAVRDGVTVEVFRGQAFEQLAQRAAQNTVRGTNVQITQDEAETRRAGMTAAIECRLADAVRRPGQATIVVPEQARAFMGMGFAEMAAECIGYRGSLRTPRLAMEAVERAFNTTSDFPGIFVDAINRRLLARYQVAPAAFLRFCAPYNSTDFRPTHVVRAGDFPTLQPVLESGEIKGGKFSESKEIFRVYPYGVTFNLSRQMIVNDQMGAIEQMLGSAGDRVRDWENAKAFAKLAEGSGVGPTLATDNTAVFASGHGNYTSSGTAIAIASLGVGRAAMMKQTSLDGLKLNLAPVTIMTGPDRLTEAEQLAVTITPAAVGSAVPDWIKRLMPVGDANISGNAWYLWADPAVAPCFVYGYLEGFTGPRLKSEEKFGVQGLGVSLEHDFGVEAIDFRGGYKNNGAAPA